MSNGVNIEDLLSNAFRVFGGNVDSENSNPRDILNSFMNLSGNGLHPPCDVAENENDIVIYIDVPGIDKNTINVDFNNNKMTVTGNREKPYDFIASRAEILYGQFEKKITLPMSITNRSNVRVSLKNGILKIHIDKAAEGQHGFNVRLDSNHTQPQE